MSNPIVTPIVHLNGTSAETLTDNLIAVGHALRDAQRALDAATPNARDYYPEPGRYELAMTQHRWRVEQLAQVLASVTSEIDVLADAT